MPPDAPGADKLQCGAPGLAEGAANHHACNTHTDGIASPMALATATPAGSANRIGSTLARACPGVIDPASTDGRNRCDAAQAKASPLHPAATKED